MNYHTLPRSGGVLDQEPYEMYVMNMCLRAEQVFELGKRWEQEDAKFIAWVNDGEK